MGKMVAVRVHEAEFTIANGRPEKVPAGGVVLLPEADAERWLELGIAEEAPRDTKTARQERIADYAERDHSVVQSIQRDTNEGAAWDVERRNERMQAAELASQQEVARLREELYATRQKLADEQRRKGGNPAPVPVNTSPLDAPTVTHPVGLAAAVRAAGGDPDVAKAERAAADEAVTTKPKAGPRKRD